MKLGAEPQGEGACGDGLVSFVERLKARCAARPARASNAGVLQAVEPPEPTSSRSFPARRLLWSRSREQPASIPRTDTSIFSLRSFDSLRIPTLAADRPHRIFT